MTDAELRKLLPFLMIAAFLGVFGVIFLLARRAERKRREALQQLALDLGLQYLPEADQALPPGLSGLHLFQQGHSRRAANLLQGKVGRDEVLLFDYRYVTGSGKSRHAHRQSVAVFAFPTPGLPELEVRPENILHRIAAVFGYQDIDFADNPAFSSHYVVRGKDEDAIRAVFDSRLMEAFENARGISVEAAGPWLVIYRADRLLPVPQLAAFLEEAHDLHAAFTTRRGVLR